MHYYTDGGCIPNPGKGGWGFICKDNGSRHWGGEHNTTNNRCELTAIIRAIEYAESVGDTEIHIFSDSQLCINTCSTWLHGWVAKGLVDKRKNPDLLRKVHPLLLRNKIEFHWVRGHNGNEYNEIADFLAGEFIRNG